MAEDNLSAPAAEPVATTPLTYNQQVEELSDLLGDPEPDHAEAKDEAAAADADPLDDDPLGLDASAEDVAQDDATDEDGSDEPEIKGGRFAPDSAKTILDDGTVITVSELKRNNLFQRDYTKKTTELKAAKEAADARQSEVDQYAQQLNQTRDFLAQVYEARMPKAPEPFQGTPSDDPLGYMQWMQQRDNYLAQQQEFSALVQTRQAEDARKTAETTRQLQERHKREAEALVKAIPVLKDPVRGKAAWAALEAGAQQHYGISSEEINSVGDHRMIVALRDALRFRNIQAKAPQVQAEVAKRPAIRDGRRAAPNAAQNRERQVRTERLRNSGSFEAGVAALQDFDL